MPFGDKFLVCELGKNYETLVLHYEENRFSTVDVMTNKKFHQERHNKYAIPPKLSVH